MHSATCLQATVAPRRPCALRRGSPGRRCMHTRRQIDRTMPPRLSHSMGAAVAAAGGGGLAGRTGAPAYPPCDVVDELLLLPHELGGRVEALGRFLGQQQQAGRLQPHPASHLRHVAPYKADSQAGRQRHQMGTQQWLRSRGLAGRDAPTQQADAPTRPLAVMRLTSLPTTPSTLLMLPRRSISPLATTSGRACSPATTTTTTISQPTLRQRALDPSIS